MIRMTWSKVTLSPPPPAVLKRTFSSWDARPVPFGCSDRRRGSEEASGGSTQRFDEEDLGCAEELDNRSRGPSRRRG